MKSQRLNKIISSMCAASLVFSMMPAQAVAKITTDLSGAQVPAALVTGSGEALGDDAKNSGKGVEDPSVPDSPDEDSSWAVNRPATNGDLADAGLVSDDLSDKGEVSDGAAEAVTGEQEDQDANPDDAVTAGAIEGVSGDVGDAVADGAGKPIEQLLAEGAVSEENLKWVDMPALEELPDSVLNETGLDDVLRQAKRLPDYNKLADGEDAGENGNVGTE